MTQVLFDRSLFAQYKQGKINAEMADARLYGSEDELRINVAKAYFDILLNKDKLAAITEEKRLCPTASVAQEMFKQGAATILIPIKLQSGYDAALAKEISYAFAQLEVAENTLANLTGLDPSQISPVKKRIRNPADFLGES